MAKQRIRGLGLRGGARIPQRGLGEIDRERALAGQSLNVLGSAIQSAISLGGEVITSAVEESRKKRFKADVARGMGEIERLMLEFASPINDPEIETSSELREAVEGFNKDGGLQARVQSVIDELDNPDAKEALTNEFVMRQLPSFMDTLEKGVAERMGLLTDKELLDTAEKHERESEPSSLVELDADADFVSGLIAGATDIPQDVARQSAKHRMAERWVNRMIIEDENPYDAYRTVRGEDFEDSMNDPVFTGRMRDEARKAVSTRVHEVVNSTALRIRGFDREAAAAGVNPIDLASEKLVALREGFREIEENSDVIRDAFGGQFPSAVHDLADNQTRVEMVVDQWEAGRAMMAQPEIPLPKDATDEASLLLYLPTFLADPSQGTLADKIYRLRDVVGASQGVRDQVKGLIGSALRNQQAPDVANQIVQMLSAARTSGKEISASPLRYGIEGRSDEAKIIGMWSSYIGTGQSPAAIQELVLNRLDSEDDPILREIEQEVNASIDDLKEDYEELRGKSFAEEPYRFFQWKRMVVDRMHISRAPFEVAKAWAMDELQMGMYTKKGETENLVYLWHGDKENEFVTRRLELDIREHTEFRGELDELQHIPWVDPKSGIKKSVFMFIGENGVPMGYLAKKDGSPFTWWPGGRKPAPLTQSEIFRLGKLEPGKSIALDIPEQDLLRPDELREARIKATVEMEASLGTTIPYPDVERAFPLLSRLQSLSEAYAAMLPSRLPNARLKELLREGKLTDGEFDTEAQIFASHVIQLYEHTQLLKANIQNTLGKPIDVGGFTVTGDNLARLQLYGFIDNAGVDVYLEKLNGLHRAVRDSQFFKDNAKAAEQMKILEIMPSQFRPRKPGIPLER